MACAPEEFRISNDDGLLRPGMYATVRIQLDESPSALTLPFRAVSRDGGESYCWGVENSQIARKPVVLGLRVGDQVEVVSGLEEDDTVVLARADSLTEGQRVEVIQDTK